MTSNGRAVVTLPTDTQILITRQYRDAHINSGTEGGMRESLSHLENVARTLAAPE
ncbi:MAG TPA: hypothetical protein VMA73_01705 [Streptosporangiaceae bacterium]|nr:hypothetical protein [Streptosporangiaceae bacterium]